MGPIGVFDSGYGGLTILKEFLKKLPQYDYIYLGDNARAPYGSRSFEVVHKFTLEAVEYLFDKGCELVIIACNTASAKALRSIQQIYLPTSHPDRRVLGIIRPTVERMGKITSNGNIGVLGTPGTILSQSYEMEISKLYPEYKVVTNACPMWVPLVENKEWSGDGADYFVQKYIHQLLAKDANIDTIILGCTHYPLLYDKIRKVTPSHIELVAQGEIIADSLADYLKRHPEMDEKCTKNGKCVYLTTESSAKFKDMASIFLNEEIDATHIDFA